MWMHGSVGSVFTKVFGFSKHNVGKEENSSGSVLKAYGLDSWIQNQTSNAWLIDDSTYVWG